MAPYKNLFKLLLPVLAICSAPKAYSQTDTLKLNFKDSESLFLQNNLTLLAQKYNVDASKALIKQAGLWDNPVLSTDQNITDNSGKFFDHSKNNGQIFLQLSQVFTTAGKRGKQVQVAKDDASIQQAAFDDLLRNLRYNLLLDFAQISNLVEQGKVYQTEIASAQNLVNAIQKSYDAGNNSLKDVVRLKALLFGLQNDLVENNRQLTQLQSELKTLLGVPADKFVLPQINFKANNTPLNAAELAEKAKTLRGDYLAGQYTLQQNNDNVALQKALAKPDVTLGVAYDQNSNYAPHYVGLQISVPLPLFNRNQGNIKAAQLSAQGQQFVVQNNALQLQNDVYSAVNQYRLSNQLLGQSETDFYDRYDQLYTNMLKGFKLRQISLPEFVDFFDSYKDTKLKILQQQFNLNKAIADLNFAVGTTVVDPL
ncbi:TolC family protein [Mucilaginibacter sp. UR6-1]|uniref:TolC family protein n=1 Tax=Mucilaginibacter sp. UR6-1 TaxID=1435643 RepID=UPI001E32A392|nr:TolC family protein [Mucilaginibacter sp. UR6-1]MCC8410131.1 TolC family protein [Mucilaginibacter sp. UR6-1]